MSDTYGAAGPSSDTLAGPLLRQIGTHLRLAREDRHQDLQEVADFLRIRRAYLQSLEAGEFAEIPGRTYALGFLRSYADYLGFDGEAIVDEVKRTNAHLPESPQLQIREPLPESQRPPLLLVGVSVLLAAFIYVGWSYWQDRQRPPVLTALGVGEGAEPGPDEAAIPPPAEDAPTAVDPAPPSLLAARPEDDADATATSETDLPPLPPIPAPPRREIETFESNEPAALLPPPDSVEAEAVIDAILEGEPDTEADAASPVDDAAAAEEATTGDILALITAESGGAELRTFGAEEGSSGVVLVANAPSWVQVRSADRAYVWTRTMEPGDAFFVPDRDDLALWTGNAGGLKVIVEGRTLATLGEQGEVRRDIPLAAEALRAQYAPD